MYMRYLTYLLEMVKLLEMETRMVAAGGRGKGELFGGYGVAVL